MSKSKSNIDIKKLITSAILVLTVLGIGVFGYITFRGKADDSRALSDLKSVYDVLMTETVSTDGKSPDKMIDCNGVKFEYALNKGKVVFSGLPETDNKTFSDKLKEIVISEVKIEGDFSIENNTITYTNKDGKGKAYWKSGKVPNN